MKGGALELSFGMIFSLILIIVFLAFGIYAIIKFVEFQQDIQIQKFLKDFQDDVNAMWKSSQGSQSKTYPLPNKINAVCFTDDELQNLEFGSERIIKGDFIENLDIEKITSNGDYCIQNIKGKVSLVISKEFGEMLVNIGRE